MKCVGKIEEVAKLKITNAFAVMDAIRRTGTTVNRNVINN